ncbi:putative auxin efflux carrier component 8, partial [Ananas comosus]
MIGWGDVYKVAAAMVPLYVALVLGYGSVRWWKVFTPEQCDVVNRLVTLFTLPFFSFDFTVHTNPLAMNYRVLAADAIAKAVTVAALACAQAACVGRTARKNKEGGSGGGWAVTGFSLATLNNTLVVGVPLVRAVYGKWAQDLVVQLAVLQAAVWMPMLLFALELRKMRLGFSSSTAPGPPVTKDIEEGAEVQTTSTAVSFRVLMKTVWLKFAVNPKFCASMVGITWSFIASRWHIEMPSVIEGSVQIMSRGGAGMAMFNMGRKIEMKFSTKVSITKHARILTSCWCLGQFMALQEKLIACGPRLTVVGMALRFIVGPATATVGAIAVGLRGDVLHLAALPQSIATFVFAKEYGLHAEVLSTAIIFGTLVSMPVLITYYVAAAMAPLYVALVLGYGSVRWWKVFTPEQCGAINRLVTLFILPFFGFDFTVHTNTLAMNYRVLAADAIAKALAVVALACAWAAAACVGRTAREKKEGGSGGGWAVTGFALAALNNTLVVGVPLVRAMYGKWAQDLVVQLSVLQAAVIKDVETKDEEEGTEVQTTSAVSFRVLMKTVWVKFAVNPNFWASMVGITWASIASRWRIEMPSIIEGSVQIMSRAGAGMAMFSMGLFMALQEKLIACGPRLTVVGMALRFIAGPAAAMVGAIAVGLRGDVLRLAIIQAALPQSITTFVFAREYGLHAEVLSTAVIFGTLVSLPVLIAYY